MDWYYICEKQKLATHAPIRFSIYKSILFASKRSK